MRRILVADSCVCGLSVVRSMQLADDVVELIFLADYAINPLGVKSDVEINAVAERWLRTAEAHADELVIACNTLSIRYVDLLNEGGLINRTVSTTTMVDYFSDTLERESALFGNARVLVLGTQYTSTQSLYPELLRTRTACASVEMFAASRLERQIARFEDDDSLADPGLREALARCDIAILACTCFPFAAESLQEAFPNKRFLDPAAHAATSATMRTDRRARKPILSVATTGAVVQPERVTQFATDCLGDRFDIRAALALGLD